MALKPSKTGYTESYWFMARVISSCLTKEQLRLCEDWVRRKGLEIDDYFSLRGHILDKIKQIESIDK